MPIVSFLDHTTERFGDAHYRLSVSADSGYESIGSWGWVALSGTWLWACGVFMYDVLLRYKRQA